MVLNSIEKMKAGFLFPYCVCFLNQRIQNSDLSTYICKWVSSTVRVRKLKEKNGVSCLVFISPSWVVVLKMSKIVPFLQFFANVSKTSKAVVAIYVYASESFHFALLENGVGYYAMTWSLEDISVWSWGILLNFCWVSILLTFYSLILCELLFRPLEKIKIHASNRSL